MKLPVLACVLASLYFASPVSAAPPASPYAGQEAREIKSLSPDEIKAYLSGKGMGLAKAAELNGYPGPAHVLELGSQLDLSPEQRARTESIFAAMESKATALGRALVEEERKLDRLFADKVIDPRLLASSLTKIGSLQAELRGAHLEAHLSQAQILRPEQIARYDQLRGYGGAHAETGHGGHHMH